MVENWRELVGFTEFTKSNGIVYYVVTGLEDDNKTTFIKVVKTNVDVELTEEELLQKLDNILTSFSTKCTDDEISTAKIDSSKKSRRGVPNIRYKNAMFYKGESKPDVPVIVGHYQGKYGIFVHPKIDNYGFVIENSKTL